MPSPPDDLAAPAPVAVPPATPEGAPFPTGLAARYVVGNLGSASVYALFNTGLPLYLESYGLSPAIIGLLANERSFVGAFVQPFVGRLSDRIRTPLGRRRPFFLVGVPLMSVSLLLLAVHPTFWLMLTLMTIGSFFLAVASDPYTALLADLFPPGQRGRVGGLLGLTSAVGAITITLLSSFLWAQHEALIFALTITILLLAYGFTFFTVREPAAPAHAPARQAPSFHPVVYVRGLLAYPEAAKLVLAVTLFWIGSGGATPFVTLFGQHALGATGGTVFFLPLAFVAANAVFAIPAGRLADRIGKKPVLMAGLFIYGGGALVGSQTQSIWQAALLLAVAGMGNAGTYVLNPLLTDLIPRSRVAEFIGLGSSVWSLVQPLGSVFAGLVVAGATLWVGQNDAYRWAFIFAGALIVAAGVLVRFVRPERVPVD